MGDKTLSNVAYHSVASRAAAAGSATYAGQERHERGLGLDPLVDPSGFGVIRRSISRKAKLEDGTFKLTVGTAMLIETRLDTTGSMDNNIEIAMKMLPTTYGMLVNGDHPMLSRYDVQMMTAIFGDIRDSYVLCRSQAEMDEKIAEQFTLMVPEGGGFGNGHEDPEYGIFGGAFLTAADINRYGLKSYDFSISDEPLLDQIDLDVLKRVFGPSVIEKVRENGHKIDPKNLPSTTEVVQNTLLTNAHAFFLHVLHGDGHDANGYDRRTTAAWTKMFGPERVVHLPRTELLPQVQAAIIGLTEGVLDLASLEDYLRETKTSTVGGRDGWTPERNVSQEEARQIKKAVSHIPIGAQRALPNFDKIPLKGAIFAKKDDVWPIDSNAAPEQDAAPKKKAGKKAGGMWE